jgi:hypothetical protein
LRTQFLNMQRNAEQDLKTSRTVEETLQAQLEEVESRYISQLEAAEAQLNTLRNQVTRYKNVHNPLPPPPQPLPLDRFPSLGRHFPSESSTTSQASVTSVTATNSHTSRPTTRNGRHRDTSWNLGANGSAHTHAIIIPGSTAAAADQVQMASSTESKKSMSDHRSRAIEEDRRVTEGPSRNRQYPQTQSAEPRQSAQSSQRHLQPQNQYPYIQSNFLGASELPRPTHAATSAHTQIAQPSTNSQARIIPGASPTHWVIPPPLPSVPRYIYSDVHARAETDWESEERPKDRYNRRHRSRNQRRSRDESSSASGQARGMPMTSASDGETDDVESRLVSASAFVAGYGSGYDEGLGYSTVYTRGGYVPAVQRDYSAPNSDSPENGVGGLGLIGIPGNIAVTGRVVQENSDGPADVTTPRQRPTQSRPNGTLTDWGTATLPIGGPREGSRQTLEQLLETGAAPSRDARSRGANVEEARRDTIGRHSLNSVSSASSWGTVNTSAQGSMSDLGLIGLDRGGVTGQGSIAEGSQIIPMIGTEEGGEAGTPRVGRADLPLGFVVEPRATRPQGYASDDERPRHLRSLSGPELPAVVDDDHNRHSIRYDEQSIRPHYTRRHTLAQSVSLDSGTLPPSAYGLQTDGNALALTFDASAPVNTSAPFTINARGVSPEYIRAPAPRMGGPSVLNLWRSGT